ncbi:MAG: ABC transporter permease [Bacteroidota bacterium]
MLKYTLRRILFFIPTLIAISLLAFIISVNAPGDPVTRLVETSQSGTELSVKSVSQKEQKKFWIQKLGLDLPLFYFSIHSLAESDTLYKVFDASERSALKRLIDEYGNWDEISNYYNSLLLLDDAYKNIKVDSASLIKYPKEEMCEAINRSVIECTSLRSEYYENAIVAKFDTLKKLYGKYDFFKMHLTLLDDAETSFENVKLGSNPWKNYVPVISFYGNNQYHRWIFGDGNWLTAEGSRFSKGVIRGDFGISYVTKEPISKIIGSRILWSLLFALLSVVMAYLVSIPVGIRSAVKKHKAFDVISSVLLYLLFSMPVFWIATLLLMSFANPDFLWIFPASGVKPVAGYPEGAGFFDRLWIVLPYLVLPLICYVYSSFAFISRTVRASVLEVLPMDYIRTARAKGLNENKVINKHALRNSLLPLITVFANVFPLAIGGSVIIESVFSIPGMGLEAYTAISTQNYPVIVAVFTLTGFFTLIGYLLSDILYATADPRINFRKK